ncbi:MAG: glycosyltransferase family 4 protein [Butyrivibrio sp.]|uniref:glycosyltransferase family 4 protein n=1 Tax=Butyrivibrio sp. TaxID=28121 RepID=UPI0025BDFE22|nr:glycosyltransferase family 4 protein [Butyrivibrio sp.]MBQ6587377.1 glycosyltransferase family 4 protein [Butyrivibrio sp.]
MKIVHICLTGPVTDGLSYQDNLLPKYHKRLGMEVSFVASKWIWGSNGKLCKTSDSDYINSDGIKMIRLDIEGKDQLSRKFKRFKGVYQTLCQEKPDVIFCHGVCFLDSLEIARYCKNHKQVKLYVDNHSDFSNSATNWHSKYILHKIIWRYTAHALDKYAIRFYGVLPARVDFLVDMYGISRDRCELLVMGADDDLVYAACDKIRNVKDELRISDNDFVILTGGKIDSAKYQTLLLMEAINRLDEKHIKLLVFGSVEDKLKEKFNSLLSDRIIYIGWHNSEELYSYIAASDLVVYPGRHSVLWEQTVAQGKPMIVKYWDGTSHVDIGGNVQFLYYDSVDEIYNKLEAFIYDSDMKKMMMEAALGSKKDTFLYSRIAYQSIRDVII